MIFNVNLNTDIAINTLKDLSKLKPLIDNGSLKVNKSALAREMEVDRRTIDKYINGYTKPCTRHRSSQFDDYYSIIKELLSNKAKKEKKKYFFYKKHLYDNLKNEYGLKCAESSFRRYISSVPEFNAYFKNTKKATVSQAAPIRFETSAGEQAELDWKEHIDFVLKSGEVITINIFVLILSYSRFRVYRLSLTKTQDILFHFMNDAFEVFGGVPIEILTDNMKTVMDEPRTEYSKGKINNKFAQFAKDYNFRVRPCIAGRPMTKAKVESPMKILDELRGYSGDKTYEELVKILEDINNRENSRYHESYAGIPLLLLDKEKDFLNPLPQEKIRSQYSIATKTAKVNNSSMISYKSNQYSVPPEYIGKILQMQVYDNQIHLYYNTNLIAVHNISNRKLNYQEENYIEIIKRTLNVDEKTVQEVAKENLKKIGERYENGT